MTALMGDAMLSWEIIKAEHRKGKTIFMSSHMFNELVTPTCDRVARSVMVTSGAWWI